MAQIPKGFAYWLSLIEWDLFATLTFRNPLPNEHRRWGLAWLHMRRVSEILGTPYSKLLIALRSEHGEQNDRPHFHYLLGGLRAGSNLQTIAFQACYDWHKANGGHAVIRPYDQSLAGADYIEKTLGGGDLDALISGSVTATAWYARQDKRAANQYEVCKFNVADRLELSRSVWKKLNFLHRALMREHASTARHSEKTGIRREYSMAAPVGDNALNMTPALPQALEGPGRAEPAAWVRQSDGTLVAA